MNTESAQSYIELFGGGSSALSLDVSYFPRLPVRGSAQEAELVEEFQKFILPCHLVRLKPSSDGSEVKFTLMVHSSVRLPASFEGVTFQKEKLRVTSFDRSSGACEKFQGEGPHYHYLCKVMMGSRRTSTTASGTFLSVGVASEEIDLVGQQLQDSSGIELEKTSTVMEKAKSSKPIHLEKKIVWNEFGMQKRAELILPEEIWSMILDKVEDSLDRYSCYKTCKVFKRLLGLCPLLEMAFPNLFLYLDKPDILNMRKVNSKLKRSLDNQLKHHPSLRPTDDGSRYQRNKAFIRKWQEFNGNAFTINFGEIDVIHGHYEGIRPEDNVNQKTVNSFWNRWTRLLKLNGRPLLTAHLTLNIPWYINVLANPLAQGGEEGKRECGFKWEKIFDMIRELGHYVLYFTINCPSPVHGYCWLDKYRIYQLIQVCLSSAPNLRSFTFILALPPADLEGLLEDEMTRSPLPDHFNLETIVNGATIAKILMAKYSEQLGKVKGANLNRLDIYQNCFEFKFSKMTEFHTTVTHLSVFDLAQMKIPNLRTLSVSFDPRSDFISKHLLDVLNNFPKLTVLKIKFDVNSAWLSERAMLQDFNSLPEQPFASQIRIVQFKHMENISYNFLCRFPKLRVLHIWKPDVTHPRAWVDKGLEEIDLHKILEGDLSLMTASNIWDVIPSLEQITYRHNSIRRIWFRPAK